jgi:dephospho-CoA kinase
MKIVGLTGGIGSGKSLVANIFNHLGIPVFHADSESKKILDSDLQVRFRFTEWFGPEIYKEDGLDRAKLAGIIFNDPEILARVNGMIHPLVMQRFIAWCGNYRQKPYVLHEAAILFESGLYKQMDMSVLVTAPEDIRLQRIINRDKTTEDAVRQRMQNQWYDEQKYPLAGFIIVNDGVSPLIPKVLEIHKKLIEISSV